LSSCLDWAAVDLAAVGAALAATGAALAAVGAALAGAAAAVLALTSALVAATGAVLTGPEDFSDIFLDSDRFLACKAERASRASLNRF